MDLFDPNPESGAIFSECGWYRYQLWRMWDASRRKVLFVMLNPSTADERKDDPTVRRCIGFARRWGYGGLFVGNLFAWRATDPLDLIAASADHDIVGPVNDNHLKRMAIQSERIVLAWGNHGRMNDRGKQVSAMFPEAECLDVTAYMQPKHPLYLRKELMPRKFKMNQS